MPSEAIEFRIDTMTNDEDFWPADRSNAHDTTIAAAVHGASQALMRRLGRAASEHGLDAIEALVLATVLTTGACAPMEIRQRIGLHRSTLSSVLDRLEREELIRRGADPYDGRRLVIRLTTGGRIQAEIVRVLIQDLEAEIAGYTSPAQRRGAAEVYAACVALDHGYSTVWD